MQMSLKGLWSQEYSSKILCLIANPSYGREKIMKIMSNLQNIFKQILC